MDEQVTRQGERRNRREQNPDQLRWVAQARCLAATLDVLLQPVVLLLPGEPVRVWYANAAARHRFSSHSELRIREGVLTTISTDCAELLAEAIAHARQHGPGHPRQIALPARVGAEVVTLQALDFGASPDLPVSEVLMLELRAAASTEHGVRRLCSEFRLSYKEAEAALGLYSMGSINQLALCTGRSVHTVRTQLKAAMQKTGTHTQAGLVALVASRLTP